MYQKTMLTGRVGKQPEIKQSSAGFYIKVPVVAEFHVNGQNVKQWYQCNIYSMNKQGLENVLNSGIMGRGAIVQMTGTHYLINNGQFIGLGFSCNQSDMKVILGSNLLQNNPEYCQPNSGSQAQPQQSQPQQAQPQYVQPQEPAPTFYEDDIPY